jgi:hypothetical protein
MERKGDEGQWLWPPARTSRRAVSPKIDARAHIKAIEIVEKIADVP